MIMEENIWHNMSEEPSLCSVVLYSEKDNTIVDAQYIGDYQFYINGLRIYAQDFTCWCNRIDFFHKTGLYNFKTKRK